MDQAAMCNLASEAARKAIEVSDELHIDLASMRVKEHWPKAGAWSREYVPYDDMPGGDWYLLEVIDQEDGKLTLWERTADNSMDPTVEEVDNILADIWEPGESNEIRTIWPYDGGSRVPGTNRNV